MSLPNWFTFAFLNNLSKMLDTGMLHERTPHPNLFIHGKSECTKRASGIT